MSTAGPPPPVDFGATAQDYARWRQGFPPEFFARVAALDVGRPGQRVLELGTGTGLLARDLARRGCRVTGLGPSPALLDEARRLDAAVGLALDYVEGRAEGTGLPAAAFDVVSAGTCGHWFDRARAAEEARRLLARGGRLLIEHLDWRRLPGNVVDATARLIDRFSPVPAGTPQGARTFQYPAWTRDLTEAGFTGWEAFAFTAPLAYTPEAWRGRVRASACVGPAMDADTLRRFDAALAAELPGDGGGALAVEHHIFGLVAWVQAAQ